MGKYAHSIGGFHIYAVNRILAAMGKYAHIHGFHIYAIYQILL
jgi:hypothetical protein